MSKRPLIHSKIQVVTPEQATAWLENNYIGNRKVNTRRIQQWVGAMERGEWRITGQGLIFDWDGFLLNGQHRLRAVVELGKPVEFYCTFNEDPENFKIMDSGLPRSMKDRTKLPCNAIAVLSLAKRIETGVVQYQLSADELTELMNLHEVDMLRIVTGKARKYISTAPVQCAVFLHLLEGNETALEDYYNMQHLQFGEMKPVIQGLTKRLLSHGTKGSGSERLETFALTYKAMLPKYATLTSVAFKNVDGYVDSLRAKMIALLYKGE